MCYHGDRLDIDMIYWELFNIKRKCCGILEFSRISAALMDFHVNYRNFKSRSFCSQSQPISFPFIIISLSHVFCWPLRPRSFYHEKKRTALRFLISRFLTYCMSCRWKYLTSYLQCLTGLKSHRISSVSFNFGKSEDSW